MKKKINLFALLCALGLTVVLAGCAKKTEKPTQPTTPPTTTTAAPVVTTTEAPEVTTTEAPEVTTTEAPVTQPPVTTTAHTHSYTEEVTTNPTCTGKGVKTFTCSCGDTYTEEIAALGHTEVVDAAVAATYDATGLTEGKHCSVCNTVLVAQEVVPKLQYVITINVEHGTVAMNNQAVPSMPVDKGTPASALSTLTVTPDEHYHFVKWQMLYEDNYIDIPNDATVQSDLTVKPLIEIDTLDVTFKDGETTQVETVNYGGSATAPSWTKTGYSLTWDKTFENVVEALTVNAVWSVNYTMSLNAESVNVYLDTTNGAGSFDLANTFTITPTLSTTPEGEVTYAYVSSDSTKVSVTNAGLVTAVANGDATITVTLTDSFTSETIEKTLIVKVINYIEIADKDGLYAMEGTNYYALTGDINLGNINGAGHTGPVIESEFNGTLNGNGHKITYTSSWASDGSNHDKSLFKTIGTTGVVKNLALSVTFDNTNGVRRAAIAHTNNGLIENCFVDITFGAPGQGGNKDWGSAGVVLANAGTINNCMVNFTYTGSDSDPSDKLCVVCTDNRGGTISNVGACKTVTNGDVPANAIPFEAWGGGTQTNCKLYASAVAVLDDFTAFVEAGFVKGTIWTTNEDGDLSFAGNVLFQYQAQVSFAETEYTVEKGGSLTVAATATFKVWSVNRS